MPLEDLDIARESMESPLGRATVYNPLKLKGLGYDVERLPYSIRVLLENMLRHSQKVEGALDAAHNLARWPSTIGDEIPFMPHRVLLQDYTGVPLVVDLAAMRDAAKRSGVDPKKVNSGVPVDLVIDHSIQVDAWGNEMAFAINLEKEYERNSERYSLLKWAQSSFRGMRVFPPGKGICHQFNLEYLSRVVAISEAGGGVQAYPDTLVGTDSHTTMVNGLACLGWGVGGIEAEAVMLGEPYHMPIPRVVGVRFKGELAEGVTPTDLVLTVTEKLRAKNVVGAFVEYFGEGYRRLSVPDRATIGNMSPEYGATCGFFPVDGNTLAYLTGTAREPLHVRFVEEYTRRLGLFVSGTEPDYSEVVEVDLGEIEPSTAGPRNPEERHVLSTMPGFTRGLYGARKPVAVVNAGPGTGGEEMQSEDGPIHAGVKDGAVVIAAITSCTNTSNPTVMVGAGLIARKAIESGLRLSPWVKASLAPGSTVVTDYLARAGLLPYLYKLGFDLVGLGCTTCIAEGTAVLMADGTSRPIEDCSVNGGDRILGPLPNGRMGFAVQSKLLNRGRRECVSLVLEDGRCLVCTPDHRILSADGWVRADELKLGEDRVVVGLDAPADIPAADEPGYVLRAGQLSFSMDSPAERAKLLAFARLLGHLLNDGSISVYGQGRMNVGQAMDREMVLADIELLTGVRPAGTRYDERKWSIVLPMPLTRAIVTLAGVQVGKRILQPPSMPHFVQEDSCPLSVVREFLGGVFGADGHSPCLHRWGPGEDDATLEPPAFSISTIPEHLGEAEEMLREMTRLLSRCGVDTQGAAIRRYHTRRSDSTYPPACHGIPRLEVRLELPDGLSFVERVGFRYCVDKMMRASAAAAYWRLLDGINKQRLWMAANIREAKASQPAMSFSQARRAVAVSLLGHEEEASLPPVVSPHYALLSGSDRLSRLPLATDRRFKPLHRVSCGFPSPSRLFREMGVLEWFRGPMQDESGGARRHPVEESLSAPAMSLKVVGRKDVGERRVYDLSVGDIHAFVAGTIAVHNCIGNSGPLAPDVEKAITSGDVYSIAVLSGNRNFDGRIHPLVKGSFLMSPMLVVAYGIAGRIDIDFASDPLGVGPGERPVYLRDLWPSMDEVRSTVDKSLSPDLFSAKYADAMKGDERWEKLTSFVDDNYHWEVSSTYIRKPDWFDEAGTSTSKRDITGARALAVLEDKVTTDHISPAGTIPVGSPAGEYLQKDGVDLLSLSTYGSRRGNHEVMVRGGFSNIRLRNLLAQGKEGGYTTHLPSGELMTIYDAAVRYRSENVPLVVLAGKQYGAGSSRDWAAKAPKLLGVRAVLAETFERIHRSNLVAMGVLPLQFEEGGGVKSIGLTGKETFEITGISGLHGPRQQADVVATGDGGKKTFKALVRVDNNTEMQYVERGGVLPYVYAKLLSEGR